MKTKWLFFSAIVLGCGSKTETNLSEQDSLAVDSSARAAVVITPATTNHFKAVTQNFEGYIPYALTEDEQEVKVWDVLSLLIEQYDTTSFHTISKNYTKPGTEETADETLTTVTTVTLTLYYNDAQELKAFKKEYSYEVGGPNNFYKTYTLCLFDGDLIAVYEDRETSIDMATKNYIRGTAKACPDCGIYLSAGVSSMDVIVSGLLSLDSFIQLGKTALQEESTLLEYAYGESFGLNGDEYVYQTVEPLDEEADYDVFYTASKGYYEKFMKPKVNQ